MEINSMVGIASSNEIREDLANDGGELEPMASEPSSDVDAVVMGMIAEHEVSIR